MRVFRSARWLLLALLLPFVSTSQAHAGVYISVGFAPPILPVYVQPPCPEPDLIWSPGYWAYGEDGYYWVPGAWVPAPYEGALWTPPYWGWQENVYVFHPGYWGEEVGYYGGVNYGFGYMGIGFIGGRWHEHRFEYNTAVVRVNETIIHTTYIDRTVIREHEVDHDRHLAYAGGPGGIRHEPNQDERRAMQVQHLAPTRFQQQHIEAARNDHANYFNANHGRPQNVALARPLPAEHHDRPAPVAIGARGGPAGANGNAGPRGELRNGQASSPMQTQRPDPGTRQLENPRQANQPQQRPGQEIRPTYPQQPQGQPRPTPEGRPAPEPRYQAPQQQRPESRRAPEPRYQAPPQQRPESRPAPEPRYQAPPQQRPESRPAPEPRYQAPPQQRPESRPVPPPRQESRPAPPPRQEMRPAPPPRQESRPAPPPRQDSRPAPEPKHDSKPQRDSRR